MTDKQKDRLFNAEALIRGSLIGTSNLAARGEEYSIMHIKRILRNVSANLERAVWEIKQHDCEIVVWTHYYGVKERFDAT